VHTRVEEVLGDDHVGAGEGGVGVGEVARLPVVDVVVGLPLLVVADDRRVGLEGLLRVRDGGQRRVHADGDGFRRTDVHPGDEVEVLYVKELRMYLPYVKCAGHVLTFDAALPLAKAKAEEVATLPPLLQAALLKAALDGGRGEVLSVLAASSDKVLSKEAKRSLHLLRTRGVAVPEAPRCKIAVIASISFVSS